ncbi:MAG: glucokinase [Burkholderiales bacterium]
MIVAADVGGTTTRLALFDRGEVGPEPVAPALAAFNAKGAFSGLARSMPVHVVLDERLGLLGAARLAETQSSG